MDGKDSCGSKASAQVCVASTAKVGAASLICGVDDDADEKKEADQPNEKAFDGERILCGRWTDEMPSAKTVPGTTVC
jgi:hypothetical protein